MSHVNLLAQYPHLSVEEPHVGVKLGITQQQFFSASLQALQLGL
jgi:hypothetical protein